MSKAGDEEEQDRKRTAHIDVPLGARLRAIRENHGLSQGDMARRLDISTNQWGRHESGKNRVPAARLWQFCQALNIEIAAVFIDQPFASAGINPDRASDAEPQQAYAADVGAVWRDETAPSPSPSPSQDGKGALVQRIGAAARELSETRQRTALAVIRALRIEDAV